MFYVQSPLLCANANALPNSKNSTWHESGGFDFHDYVPLSAADIISRQV